MRFAAIFLTLALAMGGCVSQKPTRMAAARGEKAGLGEPAVESPADKKAETGGQAEKTGEPGDAAGKYPLSHVEVEEYTESILSVIESLEECYRTGDLEKWKSLLTPLYKEKYGDPSYLRAQGWGATDLNAFFRLLIKTRNQGNVTALAISRVEFINQQKALVFVILGGSEFPEPQHTFIKIENSWLKGLPEEGE